MFAFEPADAPSINKGLYLLPLNIKYGGRLFPIAFTHPINVVVEDFEDIKDSALVLTGPMIFGGV